MDYRRIRDFGNAEQIGAFSNAVRAVAVGAEGTWCLAGDDEVRVLDVDGRLLERFATARPAWALAVDGSGHIWTGEPGQIEVFETNGHRIDTWQNERLFGLITALSVDDEVLVADARTRWIHRFDLGRGFLNHIGDRHRKGGFHIPNGVLDFAVDHDGTLVVANPGMHRVERYRRDGESLGHFGRFGQHDPAGFPGCCNPTNLAVGPRGQIVVSEKAGPRVKIYDGDGELLGVVAAGEDFDAGCKNMDLAVDGMGRIGVVDTVELRLAVYAPTATSGDAARTQEVES